MSIVDQIKAYLAPFLPYARAVVLFFLPIYIAIGEVFAVAGLGFVSVIPTESLVPAYVAMAVLIVLGVVLGVKYDPERGEKD
ncbi:MAG: hypothetical protein Kow0069_05190 [Promethearchaeota archaeon]